MQKRQKQLYLQPTMDVVWLNVTNQLLAVSGGLGSPSDYDGDTDPFANS